MTDRLTSKRTVLVLLLVTAVAILISGSREWVSGSVEDVFGVSALHGKGSDVAPGALAAALVGLASAIAVATSGRVVRVIAALTALLAALLGAVVVIGVVADPSGALGSLAAAGTGRTGTAAVHSSVGGWAWVALAATLLMGVGGLGAMVGGRRWNGLSGSYDAPVAGASPQWDSSGRPASSHDSAWEQLSRGEDPTSER